MMGSAQCGALVDRVFGLGIDHSPEHQEEAEDCAPVSWYQQCLDQGGKQKSHTTPKPGPTFFPLSHAGHGDTEQQGKHEGFPGWFFRPVYRVSLVNHPAAS